MDSSLGKVYGIIGGLGAEASAKLYLNIVEEVIIKNKKRYPAVIVWNIPITKEADEAMMKEPSDETGEVMSLLKDGIDRLIKGGAEVIGIACNTIHFLIHDLPSYNIRILNIVDCTVEKIKKCGIKRIGLLATTSSINSQIYTEPLRLNGIEVVLPSPVGQKIVMDVIFKILDKKDYDECKKRLIGVVRDMGVKSVILGCTELPLVLSRFDFEDVEVFDSLDALKEGMINL
jgi:aspartate racemase